MDAPHFSWPFSLRGSSFAVVEQDSDREIASCIAAVLSYPLGYIADRPEFGVPPQEFLQGGVSTRQMSDAILANEPRATPLLEPGQIGADLIQQVLVGFDRKAS